MNKEEFEAKVQSMPIDLQKMFRESLELSVSKRIINRFMNVVMQAYAWGQRNAQKLDFTNAETAYKQGAHDMRNTLLMVSGMNAREIYDYFQIHCSSNREGLCMVLRLDEESIFNTMERYRTEKREKDERMEKESVKEIADAIGIEKLCEIAEAIRAEAAQREELPF